MNGSIHPTPDVLVTKFSQTKPTIVVADDDPSILEAMKLVLEFHDYTVETVSDGAVVDAVETLQPKMLFLDISMPGIDGRDICKQLKAVETTKHIPVIMISANCSLPKSMKESGANDYLAKPFDLQDLLDKVSKYLSN